MLVFYTVSLDIEDEQVKMADIYNEHKYVMLRYALYIVKHKEIAEDAVHNAFLAVIKHKDKYLGLDSKALRSKLVIITKNKCIDILRRKKIYQEDSSYEIDDITGANEIPVEDQIIQSDDYETIKKYVASLDEASRIVLEMKYLCGMTYKEIGEELSISPKHVDTRIMRAKEKIRKIITESGDQIKRKHNK